jgi:hypothetical protein
MKQARINSKNKIKTFGITNKNLKWGKDFKDKNYKQHDTIDNSEPTYPNDTYRPIISHKMRINSERVYTPFFTLEFITRYKDLFKFCFNNDLAFKQYVEESLGQSLKINDLSKDEVSLPLFNFYKENPSQLFKLIKNLRKETESNLLDQGVDHLVQQQLSSNHKKAEEDIKNRINRAKKLYANKTLEAVQETAKFLNKKRKEKEQEAAELLSKKRKKEEQKAAELLSKKRKEKEQEDIQRQEILRNQNVESPSIVKMAGNFASAMKDFAKSGFLKVTEEQHNARMEICNGCEFWQQGARFGLGKCLKCGCSGAKQWIATSVCPINKWGAISKEEVEASLKEKENAEAQETQSPVSQQADGSSQEPSSEVQG